MLLSCRPRLSLMLLSLSYFVTLNAVGDTISIASGGDWGNAAHWTPAIIPNNTASQTFDVTIPASAVVELDYNATINSFTLNGSLVTGDLNPPYPPGPPFTLNVTGNVNQNGNIFDGYQGFSEPFGLADNMAVGGNFKNTGSSTFEGNFFSVAGKLINSGSMVWITYGYPPYLTNTVKIGGPITNSGNMDFNNNSSTLGSAGTTVNNSGTFDIGSLASNPVVTVAGNFTNTGNIGISNTTYVSRLYGPSTLVVDGTLTNQVNGTITLYNDSSIVGGTALGTLNARNFVNYGSATFAPGTTSSIQYLTDYGPIDGVGQLTVGTLKLAGGNPMLAPGDMLLVGSGTVPAGFTGYDQFANGTLIYAGGGVSVNGSVFLNGTLDIMLGDGYKPVGTTYTFLNYQPDGLRGTFSNVEGLVFDGGRERYVVSYDAFGVNLVGITVVATPEPSSVFLVLLGAAGVLIAAHTRSRRTPS